MLTKEKQYSDHLHLSESIDYSTFLLNIEEKKMLTINIINLYISIIWILNKCCTHRYIRRDVKFCFLRGLAHCSFISITDCSSESENTTPNQFYVNFKLSRLSLRQTLLQWLQDTFPKYQSRKMSLPIFVHDWKWLESFCQIGSKAKWYQMTVTPLHG